MGGAAVFLGVKRNHQVRLLSCWSYEDVDLWPWTLAARNLPNIAEVGLYKVANTLDTLKAGAAASGAFDEPIEEWFDHLEGRGTVVVHGPLVDSALCAGLVINVDDDCVDLFREGPPPSAITYLDGWRRRGSTAPVYRHVGRVPSAALREAGERLEEILNGEHAGPNQLDAWEARYLAGDDAVLDVPDEWPAVRDATNAAREQRCAAAVEAANAGDVERFATLWADDLGCRTTVTADVLAAAFAGGHTAIVDVVLEGADDEARVDVARGAARAGAREVLRTMLKAGGSAFAGRVAEGNEGDPFERELAAVVVDEWLALKKKPPARLDKLVRWFGLEVLERWATRWPAAQARINAERERLAVIAENGRRNADRAAALAAAIAADDDDAVAAAMADGAEIDRGSIAAQVATTSLAVFRRLFDAIAANDTSVRDAVLAVGYARDDDVGRFCATAHNGRAAIAAIARASDSVAAYERACGLGFVVSERFLEQHANVGPLPPVFHRALADVDADVRARFERALKDDAWVERLAGVGAVRWGRWRDGLLLYASGDVFGLVDVDGRLFLVVDERTRADFVAAGAGDAHAHSEKRLARVPDALVADLVRLTALARAADARVCAGV